MKVHRLNSLCTLFYVIASVRSIIRPNTSWFIDRVPTEKSRLPQGNVAARILSVLHNSSVLLLQWKLHTWKKNNNCEYTGTWKQPQRAKVCCSPLMLSFHDIYGLIAPCFCSPVSQIKSVSHNISKISISIKSVTKNTSQPLHTFRLFKGVFKVNRRAAPRFSASATKINIFRLFGHLEK